MAESNDKKITQETEQALKKILESLSKQEKPADNWQLSEQDAKRLARLIKQQLQKSLQ